MIPISKPVINKDLKKNVNLALDEGWISSRGRFIGLFEKRLQNLFNIDYCVTCSNGTAALILALKALGVKEGDEVIVPDISYAATINSVINVGATPVICEIRQDTWCLDEIKVINRITKKTKAIIAVHLYGSSCDLKELNKISKKKKIFLIEDAAEALGSKYKNSYLGTYSDIGCFSFFGNKTITTGEGGCCITSNRKLRDKLILYKNHGMNDKKKYFHNLPGYNFRLTNIQAAIGLSQLKNLKIFIKKRKLIDKYYTKKFKKLSYFLPQANLNGSQKINWIYTALFKNKSLKIAQLLLKYKIEFRRVFIPFHKMKIYKKYMPRDFDNSNSLTIYKHGLSLPTFVDITKEQLNKITSIIIKS
jgi:perosamine synthetase